MPAKPDNAKHTPGPWRVNTEHLTVIADDGHVCKVAGPSCEDAETIANARLVAACPELLTMLCRVLDEYLMRDPDNGPICALTLEQARAAISRATGEPSK